VVAGLTIVRRADRKEKVAKRTTVVELLARQGSVEVTRERIKAGKIFYLIEASEWEGFEFVYLLAGTLLLKDDNILLRAGDYFYHHGLPQRVYFKVEENVELLLISSPPSFHLVREEIQEMMALARSVEEKDEATEGHCSRIERLSLRTGERLGLTDNRLITLSYAAYLHDVGKVRIPDEILNKPGPLTEEEWKEMRRHPDYGAEMLEKKDFLKDAAEVVRAHHERYDGSGYPRGLKGDQIPLEARIIAVVDAYDAMTSNRPYRKALSKEEAIRELNKNAGSQFDPRVVRAFLKVIKEE